MQPGSRGTYLRFALPGWTGALLALVLAAQWGAGSARAGPGRPFADLSIEELMNESVTSASQKEQRLGDVAMAISVLSNEDIRRSGATSIAEALRLVPGLSVASVNASEWAISPRGFNSLYSNKMLVLVDGRAVYTPLFAGVYWDLQQTMLEDVDRIEVIRGPGATVWGANAVNGVVNIASRSARDTQGGLLYGAGGSSEGAAGARLGGQIGRNTYYRVFAGYQSVSDRSLADGQSAHDSWRGTHGGVRIDRYGQGDTHLTWQMDATAARLDNHTSDASNLNMLGRWTRQFSDRSHAEAQLYFDRTYRDESARVRARVDTTDFSSHHTFPVGERNEVVWGVGYRRSDTSIQQTTPAVQIRDRSVGLQLFSAFLQDEMQLVPKTLTLTFGTKVEHNDFTGIEAQPSIRAVYKPTARQSVWAAVSRAVRTPSIVEGRDAIALWYGAPFAGPGGALFVPTLVGNPAVESEVLRAYEVGYRAQVTKQLSFDLTAFVNEYRDLISFGPVRALVAGVPAGAAEIPWVNGLSVGTHGAEIEGNVSLLAAWRLTASATWFVTHSRRAASADPGGYEADTPRIQAMLRSSSDLTEHTRFDAQVRFVDRVLSVPGYCTADLRWAFQLTDRVEVSAMAKNILHRRQAEQTPAPFGVVAETPRSFTGKITWRF